MAFTDRNPLVQHNAPIAAHRAKRLFAASLLLALMAALALRAFVSADALAPMVATLLFATAALITGAALVPASGARRASWFDVAGVLTFIGIGISMLIEPDQMVRLITLSDRPE